MLVETGSKRPPSDGFERKVSTCSARWGAKGTIRPKAAIFFNEFVSEASQRAHTSTKRCSYCVKRVSVRFTLRASIAREAGDAVL
jgi:hypothetical protein